ncbi:MAG: hypothetical protein AB7S50_00940 [Bacteroidales bacterium]
MKDLFRLNFRKYLILFLTIHISVLLSAQTQNTQSKNAVGELVKISNYYYGIDDELINGCVYQMPDYRIMGSPYLFNELWSDGIIFINGKKYDGLLLKYDVLNEIIVLNTQINDYNRLLSINKSQIDSFYIENRLFVNSKLLFQNQEDQSFYEQITNHDFRLLIKYKKVFLKTYNNLSPYGRFSSIKKDISLYNNGTLQNANNLNSFIKGFEDKIDKKKVKNYLKQNGFNYSKASSNEFKEIITYCNTIISIQNEN